MFKKVSLYQIADERVVDILNQLKNKGEALLSEFKFKSPAKEEKSSIGFSFTKFNHEELVTQLDGDIILRVTTQSKSPNKGQIEDFYKKKLSKASEELPVGSVINKEIQKQLKEEAIQQVLADTFPSDPKHQYVVIRKSGMIMVDGKGNSAENALSLIRKALGSLPAAPLTALEGDTIDMLKSWVVEDIADSITLGEKATLVDDSENEYKAKGHLGGDEKVVSILESPAALVTHVEVSRDFIKKVTISEDLHFSGISFDKEFTQDEESLQGTLILQMKEVMMLIDDVLGRLVD